MTHTRVAVTFFQGFDIDGAFSILCRNLFLFLFLFSKQEERGREPWKRGGHKILARLRYFFSSDIFNFFRFLTIRKPRDLAQSSQVDDQLNKLFKKKIFLIPLKMKRRCALFARSPPPHQMWIRTWEKEEEVMHPFPIPHLFARNPLDSSLPPPSSSSSFLRLLYIPDVELCRECAISEVSVSVLPWQRLSLALYSSLFSLRLWGLLHRPISVTHSTSQLRSTSRDNFLPPPAPPPPKTEGMHRMEKEKESLCVIYI